MNDLILPRRKFLQAAVGIIAAPAVVRFESLMKLAQWEDPLDLFTMMEMERRRHRFIIRTSLPQTAWREFTQFELSDEILVAWVKQDKVLADIPFKPLLRHPRA